MLTCLLIPLVFRSWKSCRLLFYIVGLSDTLMWQKYCILCYSCFSVLLFSVRGAKSQAFASSTEVFFLPGFRLGDLDVDFRQSQSFFSGWAKYEQLIASASQSGKNSEYRSETWLQGLPLQACFISLTFFSADPLNWEYWTSRLIWLISLKLHKFTHTEQ